MKSIAAWMLLALLAFPLAAQSRRAAPGTFSAIEASIGDMQKALAERRVTSRELVLQSLVRIATYEDRLNAIITVNPDALAEADALDRERAAGKVRGPLHGIPIALKDNIHTTNMPTTGGALAFDALVPPYEATLTKNLRDGGAIIIAKTHLTELANWVSNGMPNNYNGLNGFGFNPYDPRRDPRDASFDGRPVLNTGGSSSGSGTAASFWAANVGTETSGSILSPANQNMLAAIKPTVGRVSRHGVIPITADQDTPGPMARSVADAAILLGVLESAAPDPADVATSRCARPANGDYTQYLRRDGLKGARIGVPRAYYYNGTTLPGDKEPSGGMTPEQKKVVDDAVAVLKAQGATVIDVEIPSIVDKDRENNLLLWSVCAGEESKGRDAGCSTVFKYGMKRDFNQWLASLGGAAPVKSLTDLRIWNITHTRAGAIRYGQTILDVSDEMDVERDRSRYERDRAKDLRLSATHGIDAVMNGEKLDALLFGGSWGAAISAKPGYPTVIVPFGFVPNAPRQAYPEKFDAKPIPFGISFAGMACSEPTLIRLAYAFEQATKKRVPPPAMK
jgi:amidase